jgi:hypothetical protein
VGGGDAQAPRAALERETQRTHRCVLSPLRCHYIGMQWNQEPGSLASTNDPARDELCDL